MKGHWTATRSWGKSADIIASQDSPIAAAIAATPPANEISGTSLDMRSRAAPRQHWSRQPSINGTSGAKPVLSTTSTNRLSQRTRKHHPVAKIEHHALAVRLDRGQSIAVTISMNVSSDVGRAAQVGKLVLSSTSLTLILHMERRLNPWLISHRALGRGSDVANVYERDLKVQTDKGRCLNLLLRLACVVSEQLEDPARAMKVFEQTLEVDPSHADALGRHNIRIVPRCSTLRRSNGLTDKES